MTDPFASLIPQSSAGEVRYVRNNSTLDTWRVCNIALPDLHVIDRSDMSMPKVLGQDGEAMTPERRKQLMEGRTPLFSCTNPDDNTTATFNDVDYTKDTIAIEPEQLGKSAIENRPKGLRVFKPITWVTPTEEIPFCISIEL